AGRVALMHMVEILPVVVVPVTAAIPVREQMGAMVVRTLGSPRVAEEVVPEGSAVMPFLLKPATVDQELNHRSAAFPPSTVAEVAVQIGDQIRVLAVVVSTAAETATTESLFLLVPPAQPTEAVGAVAA